MHTSTVISVMIVLQNLCLPALAQQTTEYNYDALGRLVGTSSSGAHGLVSVIEYDAAGNRKRLATSAVLARVENESFEYPSTSTYIYTPSAPSIVFSGLAGIARDGSAWGFPPPWNGQQVAFLQSYGGRTGAIEMKAVNLTVGKTYFVAFASSRRPGHAGNVINLYVNTTLLWNIPPDTEVNFGGHATGTFVASDVTATIRFESSATSYDSASGIDAVSVQLVN